MDHLAFVATSKAMPHIRSTSPSHTYAFIFNLHENFPGILTHSEELDHAPHCRQAPVFASRHSSDHRVLFPGPQHCRPQLIVDDDAWGFAQEDYMPDNITFWKTETQLVALGGPGLILEDGR
jgi:hypothetical protein